MASTITVRDGTFPRVTAGEYPQALKDACLAWKVEPEALLDWVVRKEGVTVILPSGLKASVEVTGEWGNNAPARAEKPGRRNRKLAD